MVYILYVADEQEVVYYVYYIFYDLYRFHFLPIALNYDIGRPHCFCHLVLLHTEVVLYNLLSCFLIYKLLILQCIY